jgi:hypothetical protein
MIKYLDIKEFREKGYLQEVNRQFLHRLGLALEISIDENGKEYISGVWDYRDDKEGVIYDLKNSDDTRKEKFKTKADYIKQEMEKFDTNRFSLYGWAYEPIE